MLVIIAAFLASMVPALLFYLWMLKIGKDRPEYQASCKKALKYGLLSTFPVVGCALVLNVLGGLAGMGDWPVLLKEAFKDLILAALVEEVWKFLHFKKVLRKAHYEYTWLDVTAFMTLVGIGFEVLEAVVYAFGTSPGQQIVRGLTLMHGVFGFLMGYLYGKALYTKKKGYFILSFVLPLVWHGLYDFTLSPEWEAVCDWIAFIPVTLALLALILVFVMIRFFRRAPKKEQYTTPLITLPSPEIEPETE